MHHVDSLVENEDGDSEYKSTWCPTPKFWWRSQESFMRRIGISNRINPMKFLRLLYWFGQRIPIEQMITYTGIKAKSLASAVGCLRLALTKKMLKMTRSDGNLG